MSFFNGPASSTRQTEDFDYLSEADIYLDSACQTLRPQPVIDAVQEYWHEYNTCGGRVKYQWGRRLDAKIAETRAKLLKLAGKSPKDYVCAFTLNTTYGINLLLSQLPDDRFERLVTSETEHNSVYLPTMTHAKRLGVERPVLGRAADGSLAYGATDLAKAAVVVGSSNNFDGAQLVNAKPLADDTHRAGGILILDAAQTMGHSPEILKSVDFDAICFSGHKMYGTSLGVIILKTEILNMLSISFIGGGTVEDVDKDSYRLIRGEPAARLEPGLQDFAGIVGLGVAVDWRSRFKPAIKEEILARKLYDGLKSIPALEILNPAPSPIASFYSPKIDAHRLAIYLSAQNIMARSGYFCVHYYLGHVKHLPPLLRLSLGLNNNEDQVDRAVAAIKKTVENA